MKKNGFIATSLIYSFFLIFITLFLTIIADYLQNKIWLNEIEKGIKDDLNSTMGIRDFEVGDMVAFISDCSKLDEEINSAPLYVIANVVNDNSTICGETKSCLILYGVTLGSFSSSSIVTYDNINQDIDMGYKNNTYYNKIIYDFSGDKYSLGGNYIVYKNSDDCMTSDEYVVGKNCIKDDGGSVSNVRERYILKDTDSTLINKRLDKCLSSNGTFYIKYTKR